MNAVVKKLDLNYYKTIIADNLYVKLSPSKTNIPIIVQKRLRYTGCGTKGRVDTSKDR